jgi:hypothetical protein
MRMTLPGARIALASVGILAVTTTCRISDVLRSPGLQDVSLSYTSDSVLVVSAPVRPAVAVTVDGAPYAQARVRFATSDTTVVGVHGDTLLPRRRGTARLTVVLESSALPRDPPTLTRTLVVVADTVTLDSSAVRFASLGDTVTLAATVRDAQGAAIAGVTVRWSSSDTAVAGVTANGRVAARGTGTATVRATVDRDTAAVAVTVTQALVRWRFEPPALLIDALTDTGRVSATGLDARGNAIPSLTPATWLVGDRTVLLLAGAGQVAALRNGSTQLYAVGGPVRDSVAVTVAQRAATIAVTPKPAPPITSLGGQVQLVARAFDRRAMEIVAAAPTWYTADAGIARVASDGLVTALATGSARVVATLDGQTDTALVTISNDPASVAVVPDSAVATSVNDTLVFRAVARNGRGDSVAAVVSWRTPDPGVVDLLADGRAVALAAGTARVIATVGGRSDTGLAKVTNVATAIDIAPTTRFYASLGDVDTLPVTITNARGAALPRGAVTWSSDDATIARVTPGGIVTARDTGQTVVRATSGSVADSVLVTVQNLPARITIGGLPVDPRTQMPTDTLTALGQSFTLVTDVRNARGAPIANFPVTWRSTWRAVVDTVTPSGVTVAVGWGTTLLVAEAGEARDTAQLTALNPTVVYVSNAIHQAPRVGTVARPYARIQDGVNAAEAGDTVVVLQGLGRYSESVNLVRRIVLMGDSSAFAANGHNPGALTLLSHDTGAYAIRAHTTAPVAVKYLAITHTLDGPAIDGDGGEVVVEWVAVNRPGSVTSAIGRGFSIANSSYPAVRNSWIYNVQGYGIRFYHAIGAAAQSDTIDMVQASMDGSNGAGIKVTGGGFNVSYSALRGTIGPMIDADSAGATIEYNDLAGLNRMVKLTDPSGTVTILHNTFRVGAYSGVGPFFYDDNNWEAGVVHIIRPTGHVNVAWNAFTNGLSPCEPAFCPLWTRDFLAVEGRSGAEQTSAVYNTAHGARWVLASRNENFSTVGNRADSVVSFYHAAGTSDFLNSDGDVVDAAYGACLTGTEAVSPGFANGNFILRGTTLSHCNLVSGPAAITFRSSTVGSHVTLEHVRVTGAPPAMMGIWVEGVGGALGLDSSVVSAGTDGADRVNGSCGGFTVCAGIRAVGSYVTLSNSELSGYHRWPGLSIDTGTVTLNASVIRANRVGLEIAQGVPVSAGSGPGHNDVFDNDSAGFRYTGISDIALPDAFWWGDGRGPRGPADLAATGDSIVSVNGALVTVSSQAAPTHAGTVGAALRMVRGGGQSATKATTLAKAFTVRVVDANGLPVSGASVVFAVTGGGGNLGGLATRTVTTNANGLAEVTLTLGAAAGPNTVTAAAASGGLGTVTFTATAN